MAVGGRTAVAALLRLWERLIEPHARITQAEDRHGARLFAILMLVHITVILLVLAIMDRAYVATVGRSVWRDRDTWVILGGTALIGFTYLLLRAGRYRLSVALYILVSAAIPLTAPFVNDPNAEIGSLATALIPPSWRRTSTPPGGSPASSSSRWGWPPPGS